MPLEKHGESLSLTRFFLFAFSALTSFTIFPAKQGIKLHLYCVDDTASKPKLPPELHASMKTA
jgi:hypothetical protein